MKGGSLDADTDMRRGTTPCGHEGRDLADAVIRLGTREIDSKLPETRRAVWSIFCLVALRRSQPADTLISDFWPPDLGDNPFLLFKPSNVWCHVTAAWQTDTVVGPRYTEHLGAGDTALNTMFIRLCWQKADSE